MLCQSEACLYSLVIHFGFWGNFFTTFPSLYSHKSTPNTPTEDGLHGGLFPTLSLLLKTQLGKLRLAKLFPVHMCNSRKLRGGLDTTVAVTTHTLTCVPSWRFGYSSTGTTTSDAYALIILLTDLHLAHAITNLETYLSARVDVLRVKI